VVVSKVGTSDNLMSKKPFYMAIWKMCVYAATSWI
jgi:hypothetical protein